jgi:hypothetical protein
MILVILTGVFFTSQAQEKIKIGELKNGKMVVTNLDVLKSYFNKSLENNGTLGTDYTLNTAPEGDRCFIYYPVKGNSKGVSSIGVMLVKNRNDFNIVAFESKIESSTPGVGGSIEVQCIGESGCVICWPNVTWNTGDWMPVVSCNCKSPQGALCNMTSKIVIKADL